MSGTEEKKEYLAARFRALDVALSGKQTEQFLLYAELLTQWNEKINLTAITAFEDIAVKHFTDSCAPVLFPELKAALEEAELLDVGSGAGFPGVPLKILFPSLRLTLMDSLAKRVRFLESLCEALSLEDVRCVHGRAEDLARKEGFREGFSVVAARAVAPMRILSEYCLPFVRKDGIFLAYKSAEPEAELAEAAGAVRKLGGGESQVFSFMLPDSEYGRSLIRIQKIAETPKKYPRKAGTAAKDPL